ncbi:zinc finger with UFM1-specific peptidase domain protein, partial [Austrofundulus limnaeus]
MLTCEICGEELLLEEDMKTHLLLSHLEREPHCPLCSLSGVSFDELRVHVLSAHPEDQDREGGPGQSMFVSGSGQSTCGSGLDQSICGSGSSVRLKAGQKHTTQNGCLLSGGAASLQEQSPEPSARFWKGPMQEVDSEPSKAEPQFSCPLCSLVCSSPSVLQDHVELHLQGPVSDQGQRRFECPMCSAVFSNSFSLQEHVEQHLDHNVDPDPDLQLASQLQQEEELKRRQEEAQQEQQEFKKLQRRFGVDGRGGYRRQTERTMERAVARGLLTPADFHCRRVELMESLASGVDDGTTRTQGILSALHEFYQTDCKDCVHVWLSADTDHYSSSVGDRGWGCGYRNFQMLFSSLKMIDTYSSLLQDKVVPCIPRIQSMIEEAWKEGLDPQGASHFNQRLQGTRAWIGATEIYVLLTSLGISSRIIDFHQPTGTAGTHPLLFDWIKQYFCQSSRSNRLPPK